MSAKDTGDLYADNRAASKFQTWLLEGIGAMALEFVIRQHYVPQEHMRSFRSTDEECVAAFNKNNGELRSAIGIRVICAEKLMYEDSTIDPNFIEVKVAREIEGNFWPVRDKLLEQPFVLMSDSEVEIARRYVMFQETRTSSSMAMMASVGLYMYDICCLLGLRENYKLPTTREEVASESRAAILQGLKTEKIGAALLRGLSVRIVETLSANFVIGDHPVLFDNIGSDVVSLGYGGSGVTAFMPLSPKRGILFYCPSINESPTPLVDDELFSSKQQLVQCSAKTVAYYNKLSFMKSDRWLIGQHEDDLQFAVAAVKSDPSLSLGTYLDLEAAFRVTFLPKVLEDLVHKDLVINKSLLRDPVSVMELKSRILSEQIAAAMDILRRKQREDDAGLSRGYVLKSSFSSF